MKKASLAGGSIQKNITEMTKTARARYTLDFKQEAVRLMLDGQSRAAARTLGMVEQTLFTELKVDLQQKLTEAVSEVVSAEHKKSADCQRNLRA